MRTRANWWNLRPRIFGVVFTVLVFSVACAATEPTPTPIPPAPPAPPSAPAVPTPGPTSTPALGPVTPTPVTLVPTPTRTLPTPTPVAAERPAYGGTLRFALDRSFDNMDPAFSIQTGLRPVMIAIFNNLVQIMPDSTITPDLAQSWDFSADGKTVTFRLQMGVKFLDGTPVDAKAIKWNYDRYLDPKVGSARRSELSPPLLRVEAPRDDTVVFHLSYPYRPLMAWLTERAGHIASPAAVERLNSYADRNGEFGRRPVGSGPFRVREWVPDARVILEPFSGYWEKGKPYLDTVVFPFITDKVVQFAMLRTGELELMHEMRPGDVIVGERISSIKIVRQDGTRHRFQHFKVKVPPWDNRNLRIAFAYATDRDTLVKVLFQGLASPAYTPIGPVYGAWYDPTIKVYQYDPQKAQQKLAEAGYPGGFSYTQQCGGLAFDIQFCEVLQAMFAKVGIKMDIQPWEDRTYANDWLEGKFKAPLVSGFSPRNDPHLNLQRWFHSKGGSNVGFQVFYSNTEYDRLIDEAATVYDLAKAKALYNRAMTILAEDAVQVFHLYETNFYGLRDTVRGFATRLDREVRLRELWLAR